MYYNVMGNPCVRYRIYIFMQFRGFEEMLANGYYFTGPTSSIKMSYVFLIAAVHIAHLIGRNYFFVSGSVYNHTKEKYSAKEYLGLSLGATFWHFLDILVGVFNVVYVPSLNNNLQ